MAIIQKKQSKRTKNLLQSKKSVSKNETSLKRPDLSKVLQKEVTQLYYNILLLVKNCQDICTQTTNHNKQNNSYNQVTLSCLKFRKLDIEFYLLFGFCDL